MMKEENIMKLEGKTALVTGASSGIGRETAILLAQAGCRVALTYHKGARAGAAVYRTCARFSEAHLFPLDVRDNKTVQRLQKGVLRQLRGLDILINNAGVPVEKPFVKQSRRDRQHQVGVNVLGLMEVTRAFLPLLLRQGKGVIINVASGLSKEVYPDLSVYCATKFAVRGFTQALAREFPKGVRVFCLNPGLTATRLSGYRGEDPARVAGIIVRAAEESLGRKSGDDIDVWEYL
jgi:NAD(P)-dependent dehydrogenase (short-subunit alcohol dehydrogenase family)